jgi:hypothetical protein
MRGLVGAMGAYVDRRAAIGINGRKHAHAQVVAIYQRCLDARAKVASLRAQLAEALPELGETEAARMEAGAGSRAGGATRKARGTLGRRQRQAIRGTIATPIAGLAVAVAERPTRSASTELALEDGERRTAARTVAEAL